MGPHWAGPIAIKGPNKECFASDRAERRAEASNPNCVGRYARKRVASTGETEFGYSPGERSPVQDFFFFDELSVLEASVLEVSVLVSFFSSFLGSPVLAVESPLPEEPELPPDFLA